MRQQGDAVNKTVHITVLFIVLIVSSCSMPVTMHKGLAVSGAGQPSSEKCGECHISIYDEWKSSGHSRAYTDPFFRSITNEYMVSPCINCHSPESAFSEEIRRREAHPEEGVNCQTCHLRSGMLQGPVEKHLPFDIHPIMEKNPDYLESALCGNCHRKTFEEYNKSGKKEKTCQDCHMPDVKRTIIDNRPWVWLKDRYTFRTHSFAVEEAESIREKIDIQINIRETSPVSGDVVIQNISIPHNVPTGGYGYHEIMMSISLVDEMGETVEKVSYSMTQEMKTSLQSGEMRKIPFRFSVMNEFPSAVKVVLLKTDFTRKDVKVISQKTFKL